MMTNRKMNEPARAARFSRGGASRFLVIVPLLGLAACDFGRLLEVPDPDVVLPGVVEGPETLSSVRANALGDFAVAYVGNPAPTINTEGQILVSGLLADEFIYTGTFDTREIIDRRIAAASNASLSGPYQALHRARASAERATEIFAEFDPNTPWHAEVQSLAGYARVMFAENYCPGVPLSRQLRDGSLQFGEPLTTLQMFDSALVSFDGALATATAAGSAQQQNLARLGRARALLGKGQYAEAASVASAVPTAFEYVVFHSEGSSRQNNGVWNFNNNTGHWSVGNREGGNGLPFRSDGDVDGTVRDPRVPTEHIGLAFRGELRPGEHWGQLKFPDRASSTVLANGIEARLIEAEAALRAGPTGLVSFVNLHNGLRAAVGLPALSLADVTLMSQDQRVNLHFQERAYWLWLTSRRLGDLRRMIWDYGRRQEDIFPVGTHFRGAPYGSDTNLPLSFDEQNNPLGGECITRIDTAR